VAIRHDDGSWTVQGERLTFPVRIRDASAAVAVHLVPTPLVRGVLADAGVRMAPVSLLGRTPVVVLFVDYRDNDLGDYDEVGLAVLVRHHGRTGAHILQLPVTQEFTMEAGRALWGLPKWLAGADLTFEGGRVRCLLDDGDRQVLRAHLRTTTPALPLTVPASLTTLAPRDEVVLASPVRVRARGLRLGSGGSMLPGTGHPMAQQMRAMGLPRRPVLTAVVDHVAFDMDPAVELPAR